MNTRTRAGIWIAGLLVCAWLTPCTDVQAQKKRKDRKNAPITAQADPAFAGKADDLYFDALRARMKDDDQEAEQLLLRFTRLKPDEPAGHYDLARLNFKNGKTDQAHHHIRKALALDENNKWYREQYAHILAARNQFEEAAKVFEQLAKDEKHNQDYLLLSSRLYQRAGKYKESLQVIDRLIAKEGEDETILLQKQQIYLRMNDLESAARIIRQLIDKNPKEPRYYAILAELYENNDQQARADEVYREMEKLFPDDPGTQLSLALFYKKKKDIDRYESYVKRAITNKELDAETQISLLLPYLQETGEDSSRRQDGIDLAAQLAAQHPDNGQILGFYGDVLMLNDKREEGLIQYKKALEADPSRFNVWQQLLFNYTDRASADSLVLYSEKAMLFFPNQAIIHYLNGIGHFNLKKHMEAIKALNRAADLQPEDQPELLADVYAMLGDVYNLLREYEQSDSSYERALRLAPANATVLNNYSYYLSERGVRLDDAERMSRQSLVIRPDEATFLDTYGWILYKQGKYEKAESYIRKAINSNTDEADGTLWDHLGDIRYRLGDVSQAVEYWQKAKEKGSENDQLDKKIKDRKLYE